MSDDLAPIEVFCSYAPEDESSFQQLQKHLSLLTRQEGIVLWHCRQITPGTDWAQTIDTQVNRASVILLLISADFLASDYCYGVEMQRAMARQSVNEAWAIPILVRPVDWQKAPFAHLQVLPSNGEPITRWGDQDEAWTHVVEGIRTVLDEVHDLMLSTPPSSLPRIWMIPFSRNRFFTGQAAILERLADTLKRSRATALSQSQAISGLGGIGKTQIAIEYAYQHQEEYEAILWVRSDTHEALVSGYVTLAEVLNLHEKDGRDQTIIVQAVVRWLTTHTGWLLVLDNADDPSLVLPFLPSVHSGHILLTTRALAIGMIADPLVVDALSQDEGALLLLRRARLIGQNTLLEATLPTDLTIAQEISKELGGLPLALDQAGAYLEETGCSLAHYQQAYQHRRKELLEWRRHLPSDYSETVATTWSLSFERVKRQNPAAADLLCCCALLHPDAIPEELFADGARHLGSRLRRVARDSLVLDDTVRVLLAYSLIHRDPTTTTLSVHRLVQAVLIDTTMPTKLRKQWKNRIVQAVNEAFPEVEFGEWVRCARLLPHVLVCATWIEHELIAAPAAAHVLDKAGTYLRERGQYSEAEPLYLWALAIRELHLGSEHPETARSLNDLAELYRLQWKYEQAEPLYLRALAIREQCLGAEHPQTARSLNDLAYLYWQHSRYEQAEPLYLRALAIHEQHMGAEHPETARSLNNLAILYWQYGKYEQAEPLWKRALAIREQHLGAEHPDTASSLNNLALLYNHQRKYEQAEPLWKRTLAIREQHLGAEHPETARSLNNLAELYRYQGKYEQAEPLYLRALAIREQHLGTGHINTATSLNNLASLYLLQGKHEQAELLYEQARAIYEQQLGADNQYTAEVYYGLASLYQRQGKYEQAEAFYQRALAIREQRLGSTHPETQETREAYTTFLRLVGRDAEATMPETGHTEGDH